MQILQLPLRGLQLGFCAVVLALSVVLVKGQLEGNAPTITKFEAFCGAFGIIVAALGVVAGFVEAIPGLVMAGVDALCTLFLLAGSIAFAVKLKVHSCAPDPGAFDDTWKGFAIDKANPYTVSNDVINAGLPGDNVDYPGRCRMAQADTAFLFFAFACFAVIIGLDFMGGGSGGGGMRLPGRRGHGIV